MVNSLMADVLQNYNRPVHFANLENKVPKNTQTSTSFSYPSDIQMFNTSGKRLNVMHRIRLHGNETRLLIEKIFEMRCKQVCIYILGSFT